MSQETRRVFSRLIFTWITITLVEVESKIYYKSCSAVIFYWIQLKEQLYKAEMRPVYLSISFRFIHWRNCNLWAWVIVHKMCNGGYTLLVSLFLSSSSASLSMSKSKSTKLLHSHWIMQHPLWTRCVCVCAINRVKRMHFFFFLILHSYYDDSWHFQEERKEKKLQFRKYSHKVNNWTKEQNKDNSYKRQWK